MNASRGLYLDTSALLPYYREEAVSNKVQKLLMSVAVPPLLTILSKVEFASALSRWVRMGELSETQAIDMEMAYREDIKAGCYRLVPMTMRHFRQAERWLLSRRNAMRTLDALHLASAHAQGAELVTCDQVLARSAKRLGVEYRLLTP
jgi:predicted nucleic acid-binding protein